MTMRYLQLNLDDDHRAMRDQRGQEATTPEAQRAVAIARQSLCGDKEILQCVLANHPTIGKTMSDLATYVRINTQIHAVEDPGTLALQEDDWNWLKEKYETGRFDRQINDHLGNEASLFPAGLKLRIGDLFARLSAAPTTAPEATVPTDDSKTQKNTSLKQIAASTR
jgi:hypothetical protein